MEQHQAGDQPPHQLHFQEIGSPDENPTLVFIHGACSTGQGWYLVTHHLQDDYHILLPDLPHHGGSAEIKPFSIESSADFVADLIEHRARGGKAHIIGLSLGAHVAIALASSYPEKMETVFVSGYETYTSVTPETMARGLWLQSRIESVVPRSWIKWAMDGADFPSAPKPSMELCREIAAPHSLGEGARKELRPWKARTLIVAAGKKDWLPTADRPEDARRLRDLLITAQDGRTKAVTYAEIRHPWDRQRPELFAKAVKAWIEDGKIVEGFVEL